MWDKCMNVEKGSLLHTKMAEGLVLNMWHLKNHTIAEHEARIAVKIH